ncbi:UNVERIFIED_CONTAM: hypothetical protein FKN15_060636 [Acipenser sinensis]
MWPALCSLSKANPSALFYRFPTRCLSAPGFGGLCLTSSEGSTRRVREPFTVISLQVLIAPGLLPLPREVPLPSQSPFMCFQILMQATFETELSPPSRTAAQSGISSYPNFQVRALSACF